MIIILIVRDVHSLMFKFWRQNFTRFCKILAPQYNDDNSYYDKRVKKLKNLLVKSRFLIHFGAKINGSLAL